VSVIGGLLSTMSALNATVMAASRVAFSMGRDRWLPRQMSVIHPKRRTPQMAIWVTGVILLVTALALPLEAVGSAASLMFLLTFAMVNLSLIVLRRKYPELPRRFKVPLYPYLPIVGFSLNIFLAVYQFSFQPIAWYVTMGWVGLGLFLYYAVFEKGSAELKPQVLIPRPAANGAVESPSVLMALHNPDNVDTLLNIAIPLAQQRGHRLVATTVVEVPRQVPIQDGLRFAHHKEPLLSLAKKVARERGYQLETDLVIAHHAADGIQNAAEQHNAEALVMGWKGFTNAPDRIFGEVADRVIRQAPCDLFMLKVGDERTYLKCLLPTSGGPNAKLAAEVIKGLGEQEHMAVTAATVIPLEANPQQHADAERRMVETMAQADHEMDYGLQVIEAKSVAGGIAKASRDYDLVVIGAAKEPLFRTMLFGEIPEKVARYSPTSVLVVKKYEGVVKSLLKRILG